MDQRLTGCACRCDSIGVVGIDPMSLTITTNNVPRETVYACEVSPAEYTKLREQFDYLEQEDFDGMEFFKYKGEWYSVGDFMRVDANSGIDNNKWDGYSSDSYFSGVLMKYCYDGTVIVGQYFS